ncbi:DUF4192 family protein [Streptomyces sp. NPDC051243]|uniref:DUF4192 family protein n=1 Tax=Streptomyces sp. NPDC051243 TaxID=3365646 RepID=UPI0037BE0087
MYGPSSPAAAFRPTPTHRPGPVLAWYALRQGDLPVARLVLREALTAHPDHQMADTIHDAIKRGRRWPSPYRPVTDGWCRPSAPTRRKTDSPEAPAPSRGHPERGAAESHPRRPTLASAASRC